MPYDNLCNIDRIKSSHAWYPLEDIKEDLYDIEQLDFTLPSDQKTIKARVNEMMKGLEYKPFNTINRFPRQACFVYMEAPDIIKAFFNLKKALSHQPLLSQDKWEENQDPFYQIDKMIASIDLNNTTKDYYDSLMSLKMIIAEGTHTYSRSKFEEKFNVKWKND